MKATSGKMHVMVLEFLGVLAIALIGLMGTTSCKHNRPCDSQNITYHIDPFIAADCMTCDPVQPFPTTNVLNVKRGNTVHYSGGWPLPPGSSINFLANRNGGEIVTAQFVKICFVGGVPKTQICDGNVLTPSFSKDCAITSHRIRIRCTCKCYP